VKISQPEHGGNGVSPRVVNQWFQRRPAKLWPPDRRSPANRGRRSVPLSDNVLQQIITRPDLRSRQMNLFDCARRQSFGACRGAKEVRDDWDGYSGDGPGERRDFPRSCIRRFSLKSVSPGEGTHHLWQIDDSESFKKFGRASRVAGVTCATTTLSPTGSSH